MHVMHMHMHVMHMHVMPHARHRHARSRHASCPRFPSATRFPFAYLLSSRERVPRHARSPVRQPPCPHPRSTHAMHLGGGHQSSPCTHTDTRHQHTHTHRQRVRVKVVGLEDDCVVGYEINLVVGCVCCWFSPPRAQIPLSDSPCAQVTSRKEG